MKKPSREDLKRIFKKVKKLRIPNGYEEVEFDGLKYYSWIDQTDNVLYTLAEIEGAVTGIRWDITKPGNVGVRLEMCEICRKHKKTGEVALLSAKTKKRPKGINYRTRGHYACIDYISCNEAMEDSSGIRKLFDLIIKN
ncbi:hypothetical protein GF357_04375 [Candidatus Dojkabacteria bacterium]|nr:hypothetical protein [Candidatus Dojkabacteria bacterium]